MLIWIQKPLKFLLLNILVTGAYWQPLSFNIVTVTSQKSRNTQRINTSTVSEKTSGSESNGHKNIQRDHGHTNGREFDTTPKVTDLRASRLHRHPTLSSTADISHTRSHNATPLFSNCRQKLEAQAGGSGPSTRSWSPLPRPPSPH